MDQTIKLDTRKREDAICKARIAPLRRGERGNVPLTVSVRRDRRPYDLAGMTAHLVWQAADGKLVGPVPMEVADTASGTVRCTLPDACYSAVGMARAYIELRRGAELVDTTDELGVKVLDCIGPDAEQAAAYALLEDYRSGGQETWTHPDSPGAAFAGWYRDPALTVPCTVDDVRGPAYAKFVKVADLFRFMGCSLDTSGNVPAEYTTPRFSYIMSVPEGVTSIEDGWYFKKVSDPTKPDVRRLSRNNVVQTGNAVFASMTFNKVTPEYYEKKFSMKAFVKYTTADGTTVEAVEADYDAFTPAEIADAVLAHPMATQADKDYAAAIKAAVTQEGAA